MAFITKEDLSTHIYSEIVREITRDYLTELANLASFPATGITGMKYKALDTGKFYLWNGLNAFVELTPVDLVALAIKQGVEEAKGYLNRFDIVKMTSDDDDKRTYSNEHFSSIIKDIICWKLVKLSNPNIKLELFRTAYEDAIKYLKDAMRGNVDPEWPLKDDNLATPFDESGHIYASSNPKRRNHY